MLRFLLTAAGALFLAVALVFAVSDIARSIAQDATLTTTVAEALLSVGVAPQTGSDADQAAFDVVAEVSNWPASLTLGGAALLFLFLGRPRARARGRVAR